MKSAPNLVLIGPMGAGKTSIGRRLALRLGLQFVDADQRLEQVTGATVPLIFEHEGEAGFRQREMQLISELMVGSHQLIATGGGAFIQADTRALILARTLAVWLDADIATLVERVRRRNNRPLLTGRDPGLVLTELAAVRNPIYAQAPIRIPSKSTPHGDTVAAIITALIAANRRPQEGPSA